MSRRLPPDGRSEEDQRSRGSQTEIETAARVEAIARRKAETKEEAKARRLAEAEAKRKAEEKKKYIQRIDKRAASARAKRAADPNPRRHPNKVNNGGVINPDGTRKIYPSRNGSVPKNFKPRNSLGVSNRGPTRITRDLKQGIIDAAEQLGYDGKGKDGMVGYLRYLGRYYPQQFASLIGRIIPLQVTGSIDTFIGAVNITPIPSDRYLTADQIQEMDPNKTIDVEPGSASPSDPVEPDLAEIEFPATGTDGD